MDADAAHWAACKVKGCARCVFIRNREEWQAKLPMGDLGVSWLHGYLDRDDGLFKLKCRACEKTMQTNRFASGVVTTLFGNLSRHHGCSQHQSALASLGLGPEREEVPAPAAADFHRVAENRFKGTHGNIVIDLADVLSPLALVGLRGLPVLQTTTDYCYYYYYDDYYHYYYYYCCC